VSAIFVGLMATTVIGATGLSVDVGNIVWQKQRMQNGVDNAALAIAQDCALSRSTCATAGANPALSTANLLVSQNIAGATVTVPGPVTESSLTVTVKASKSILLSFASAMGIGPKTASVSATASWDEAPSSGYPLVPLGIGYCQYIANAYPATNHLTVRTDIADNAFVTLSGLQMETIFPDRSCQSRTGQTLNMSDGAVWLDTLNTELNFFDKSNMSVCNMKVDLIETILVTSISRLHAPMSCVNKLKVGTIMMMPVYESTSPLSTVLTSSLTIKIVGFAPFKITGWDIGNGHKADASAPACPNITILLLTFGCQAIQGYFVRSVVQDPDQIFAYDSSAPDLGGVRLTPRLTN